MSEISPILNSFFGFERDKWWFSDSPPSMACDREELNNLIKNSAPVMRRNFTFFLYLPNSSSSSRVARKNVASSIMISFLRKIFLMPMIMRFLFILISRLSLRDEV